LGRGSAGSNITAREFIDPPRSIKDPESDSHLSFSQESAIASEGKRYAAANKLRKGNDDTYYIEHTFFSTKDGITSYDRLVPREVLL
jgi:hypothetical protein